MKKLITILMMFSVIGISAQTNLVGRVYYHPNIMGDEIENIVKDADKEMGKARSEAIAKAEAKKGRKLTDEELAEVDKQIEEVHKMMMAMKKGMKTTVTATFKDEKTLVMDAEMKVSEDALKAAGIGWAKRKLMKAVLAVAPSKEKYIYSVSGNLIYIDDGKERDTLRLSDDGKYLYGKLDEKRKFKLTRMK